MVKNRTALSIGEIQAGLRNKEFTLQEMMDHIYKVIEEFQDYNIWIHLVAKEKVLEKIRSFEHTSETLPLYGIPFAVKDNIDVAGIPTTAACREFSYVPENSAEVVEILESAGAILIGKTNLDQFATGLVGTRSPYGIVKNSIHPEYISGGSSSGSAVAVALGMVSFSLGTDTAGSGRVPAGFNNIIGIKPTKGIISTNGVVPACKSLDCVSVFSKNLSDGETVFQLLSGHYNPVISESHYLKVGIPVKNLLEFFGDEDYAMMFNKAVMNISNKATVKEIDFLPFIKTANLLYNGPWVAERIAGLRGFYENNRQFLLNEIQTIFDSSLQFSAIDTFASLHQLEELKAEVEDILNTIDFLVVPTTPTIYTIQQVLKDPIRLNSNLGYYTNFVNLLELCAVSLPAGFTKAGLPMGITLIGRKGEDDYIISMAKILEPFIAS